MVLEDETDVRPFGDQLIEGQSRWQVVGKRHYVADVNQSNTVLVEVVFDTLSDPRGTTFDLLQKIRRCSIIICTGREQNSPQREGVIGLIGELGQPKAIGFLGKV